MLSSVMLRGLVWWQVCPPGPHQSQWPACRAQPVTPPAGRTTSRHTAPHSYPRIPAPHARQKAGLPHHNITFYRNNLVTESCYPLPLQQTDCTVELCCPPAICLADGFQVKMVAGSGGLGVVMLGSIHQSILRRHQTRADCTAGQTSLVGWHQ